MKHDTLDLQEGRICYSYAEARDAHVLLAAAAQLIDDIARSGHPHASERCEEWLYANGFECRTKVKRDRQRRSDELDKEIARLQAEREELLK